MRFNKTALPLLTVVCIFGFESVLDGPTWSDPSGVFSVEADLVRVDGEGVVIKAQDGKEFTIPVAQLCEADRVYLKRPVRKRKPLLTPAVEEIIRLSGFAPLRPDPRATFEADYARKLRDWIGRNWEIPMKKLGEEFGYGKDVFSYWKRSLDFLFLPENAPERRGLNLAELIEVGTGLHEDIHCTDPLLLFCLAELRRAS